MLRRTLLISIFATAVALNAAPVVAESGAAGGPAATRLSGPVVHETLAVYFVHGASAPGRAPLTLEEAMGRDFLRITETKRVSELEVENTGDEEVLIHAGDIVKGGWQDRVLSTTLVLPPRSGKLLIGAYCVEAGRWKQRGKENAATFLSAGEVLPSREGKLAMLSMPTQPAAMPDRSVSAAIEPRRNRPVDGDRIEQRQVAAPPADAQRKIWDSVGAVQALLASSVGSSVADADSKTSLPLTLGNAKVAEARQAYMAAIEPKGAEAGDILGFVYAVNGRIAVAETYASNAVFVKLWPKLLRAAVTEAVAAEKSLPRLEAPGVAMVEAFLAAEPPATTVSRQLVAGVEQDVRESKDAVLNVFKRADGAAVHRSLLAR